MALGRLFLISSWISEDTPPGQAVPAAVIERIRGLHAFVAENAKSARRFLAACGHPGPMRELAIAELNEHTPPGEVAALLEPVRSGKDLGLLSEAGAPAIADPGSLLVAAAHREGIEVHPLVGPSSVVLALMASGLEGQRFRFLGYLPAQAEARRERLAQIERSSAEHAETQIFIETPYRNDALLADVLRACHGETRLAVAAELTSPRQWIRLDPVRSWRERPSVIGKRPAVFLLLAPARAARR